MQIDNFTEIDSYIKDYAIKFEYTKKGNPMFEINIYSIVHEDIIILQNIIYYLESMRATLNLNNGKYNVIIKFNEKTIKSYVDNIISLLNSKIEYVL